MRKTCKRIIFISMLMLFAFLTNIIAETESRIIDKHINFGMRTTAKRDIDAIIVHSTFNNSGGDKYDIDLIIKQFSRYRVSSHYIIGRDGTIYQLVKESNVSYHAGKSQLPDGQTSVNSCSIGIELLTSFDESPTPEQIQSLTLLVKDIQHRYNIKYVLRHSDIAPERKTDPWNMDWTEFLKKLNQQNPA